VNKNIYIIIFSILFVAVGIAQEEAPKDQERDSLQDKLRSDGVVFEDAQLKKIKPINPLAPSRAAFYSAVFPGLGQIYNKRYWKVPLVYAVIGGGILIYDFNNTQYNRFRDAFKSRQAGFTNDEFFDLNPDDGITPTQADLGLDDLENQQERFQRDRDLALVVTILMYALNIVDANVDAHLKQFNIDDKLSMEMEFSPYIDLNPITSNPNYGMALVVKF